MASTYLPREELERRLRDMYATRDPASSEFQALCNRASEVEIQMALFIHDEGVRGTDSQDILQAIGQIMGLMIGNAVAPWSGDHKKAAVAMLNGNLNDALARSLVDDQADYVSMKADG